MSIPSIFPGNSLNSLNGRRQLDLMRAVILLAVALITPAVLAIGAFGQSNGFQVIKTINVDISPFGDQLSPDGTKVWVANSGGLYDNSDQVTLIDVSTLTEEPFEVCAGIAGTEQALCKQKGELAKKQAALESHSSQAVGTVQTSGQRASVSQ
jgi:hypothetical protein